MSTAAIAEVDYPDSDGEPLAETPWHLAAITYLLQALKGRYADRDDVYVAATPTAGRSRRGWRGSPRR